MRKELANVCLNNSRPVHVKKGTKKFYVQSFATDFGHRASPSTSYRGELFRSNNILTIQ